MDFFKLTKKENRKYGVAVIVGIIAGIFSGFVKLGVEVPWPPRTPDRITPPTVLLQHMGIAVEKMTYHFSGIDINYGNFIIHFGFALVFGVIYCVIAEAWPKVKLWQGVAFAIVVTIIFHMILLPVMGLTPPFSALPADEYKAEIIGHVIWMWSIEIVRRDLRSRFTKRPDPEYDV